MLDFSPFRPETNGRKRGGLQDLGFYPREGSAPPEDPLRCTRCPFAAPRPFAPFAARVHPPGTGAPLLRATSTRAARDSANTILCSGRSAATFARNSFRSEAHISLSPSLWATKRRRGGM